MIDTDIGSDIDDELALATVLGAGVDLLGCTTVYGDTTLRARIVKSLAAVAGHSVTAIPGLGTPLFGAPVWLAGHEGNLYPALDSVEVPDGDFRELLATPGAEVLAVGPLTNIAAVPEARSLTIMGGSWFTPGKPEHNFASDAAAASAVFASGAAIRVVGLDVTLQVTLDDPAVSRIAASGPVGALLATGIRQWLRVFNEDLNTPHDAVTAMVLLAPELFTFTPPGRVTISPTGASEFMPDPSGTVRIATGVDIPAVTSRIIENICRLGPVLEDGAEPRQDLGELA